MVTQKIHDVTFTGTSVKDGSNIVANIISGKQKAEV